METQQPKMIAMTVIVDVVGHHYRIIETHDLEVYVVRVITNLEMYVISQVLRQETSSVKMNMERKYEDITALARNQRLQNHVPLILMENTVVTMMV